MWMRESASEKDSLDKKNCEDDDEDEDEPQQEPHQQQLCMFSAVF